MNNLVLIRDNEIAFTMRVYRSTGAYVDLSPDQLLFSKGLLFPIGIAAMEIPLYLDDPENYYCHPDTNRVAGLLLSKNRLHEMTIMNGQIHRGVVPRGPGVRYARSNDIQYELAALAALELTSSLNEALDLIHKTLPFDRNSYKIADMSKFDEIIKNAKERGADK